MSEPYRSAGGLVCPRCGTPLAASADAFACPSACGTWMPRSVVDKLVGSRPLVVLCTQEPDWVDVLEHTKCLVCTRMLDPLYPTVEPARSLAIGVCRDDGIWLQRATRSDFMAAFAIAARRERNILELMAALKAGDDASHRIIAMRIVALEEQLAALEKRVKR